MRIGIVSPTAAGANSLSSVVRAHGRCEVAWIVATDNSAINACARQTPDLMIMDLRFNGIDSIDVTRRVMSQSPCPILLVTDSLRLRSADLYEAVGLGALDAVEMPLLDRACSANGAALIAKIDTIARLVAPGGARRPPPPPLSSRAHSSEMLIAIGASAGGPAAVSAILAALPTDLPAAVVIVQHVAEQFMPAMVQWLDERSPSRVVLAQPGDRPTPGRITMAGAGGHLTLTEAGRFAYTAEPLHAAYCPSVDVFFDSVCRSWKGEAVGVLLTGMGRDGAIGLKAMRDAGHHTIAQDEASSAVYGMPKAAAALDAAVEILPLTAINIRLVARLHEFVSRVADRA